ncbi:hypothetical protein [Paenibacillus azoreducens]|uniref:Uncharacterized protein n=1 Tax=Paenibacillus azoreducens TaxID=116718 RepID=A0A919YCZ1_9BACL|nr:hypothetical protein [Paenibacillus azoreducens]GIO48454.1 hypothetical protein J34TS1_32190 [Paenibacillus azoreducens]
MFRLIRADKEKFDFVVDSQTATFIIGVMLTALKNKYVDASKDEKAYIERAFKDILTLKLSDDNYE